MSEDHRVPDDVLAELPIFEGMDRDQRRKLADIGSLHQYQRGDLVLEQGESSQQLWVVLSGNCRVLRKPHTQPGCIVQLAELGPQDHFGEMSFFHAAPHSASVEATDAVELLRIDRVEYDRLIEHGDVAAYKLALNCVDELADRLRRMDDWVTDLVCQQRDERQVSEWTRFREKLFTNAFR
jgi:CRP/FNR family transcriptional regulator, cyclic AMP receptor protein